MAVKETFRATYSPEDNKLRLYTDERLDPETYARVKAAGFIWAPRQKLFVAPKWTPEREDLLLDLCEDIEDEEMTLEERAEVRAERFDGYSERRGAEAEIAREGVAKIANGIPLGQPILVGHHSARKAQKDAERIEAGMHRAVKLRDTARYWEARAEGVLHHAEYKALPTVRARRIKTLEAEQRKHQRDLKQAIARSAAWSKVAATEDPAAQLKLAINVALACHSWRTDDALKDGSVTPAHAAEVAIGTATYAQRMADRWITHLTNRLAYERVLLGRAPDEATKVDRTRKGAAALPLLNYAAERIEVQNRWRRGEVETLRQVAMTAAEFKRIDDNYKGTRVASDGTHRVRIAVPSREYLAVFLSDSKAHPVPAAKAPAPVEPEPEEDAVDEETAAEPEPEEQDDAPPPPPVVLVPRVVEEPEVDPFEQMRAALRTGVKTIAVPQLFETPAPLARRVVKAAGVEPGDLVLEPEAGLGAIATVARDAGGVVRCVEFNVAASARLRDLGFDVRTADFLDLRPEDFGVLFDRVPMNPPFHGQADIRHVVHAMRMLRVGGTLAAVMGAGVLSNGNKLAEQFRAFVEANDGEIEELPAGSFVQSGTNVNTVLVTMTRAEAVMVPSLPVLLPDGWRDPEPKAAAE